MYHVELRRKDYHFWAYKATSFVRRSNFIGDENQPRIVGDPA